MKKKEKYLFILEGYWEKDEIENLIRTINKPTTTNIFINVRKGQRIIKHKIQ